MKKWTIIITGIILLSLGLNLLLEPHALVIGGATGIAVIFKKTFNIPLYITNLLIDIPLVIAAIKLKGFSFVKDTLIATILLSAFLAVTSYLPVIKTDLILAAVFGGLLCGVGIGLILKGNTTTGGSDLLALIIHQFYPHITTARIMIVIDMIIVISGAFVLGVTPALYALISIYIIGKTIDIVLEGFDFAKAVFITSSNCAALPICSKSPNSLSAASTFSAMVANISFCSAFCCRLWMSRYAQNPAMHSSKIAMMMAMTCAPLYVRFWGMFSPSSIFPYSKFWCTLTYLPALFFS